MEPSIFRANIPAGQVDSIRYTQGERIETGVAVFRGTFNGADAAYHLFRACPKTDNWYRFARNQYKPYILRVMAQVRASHEDQNIVIEKKERKQKGIEIYSVAGRKKATEEKRDIEYCDIIISEPVDCSLSRWAKDNDLTDENGRLAQPFRQILQDIVVGMMYFRRVLGRWHGNISAKSIYISKGRAKLGHTIDSQMVRGGGGADIDVGALRKMVILLFEEDEVPSELLNLCDSMLCNRLYDHSLGHPVLLSPDERIHWREAAYLKIIASGQQTDGETEWRREYYLRHGDGLNWIHQLRNVTSDFDNNLKHCYYSGRKGLDFLRFCRSILHHPPADFQFSKAPYEPPISTVLQKKKTYTWDMLDAVFNEILPDFMLCLYAIYPYYTDDPFKPAQF